MGLTVRAMATDRLPWLCKRSGCTFSPFLRGIEAVTPEGEIKGAVGFDSWMGNAGHMHIALESPSALRVLLRPAARYFFQDCGKDVALGFLPAHNEKALKLDKHIGFREVYRIKDGAAPGDDMVLLELRKEAVGRWLNG